MSTPLHYSIIKMGKYQVMKPANEVDVSGVKYKEETLKVFVKMLEVPLIGSSIVDLLTKNNGMTEIFRNTVIPEESMFRPEFTSQKSELDVVIVGEDESPIADWKQP